MKFNHGIAAYGPRIERDYHAIVVNTMALIKGEHPNWTLSCSRSDQYLGPIGFTCTGRCLALYSCDCDSYVDEETGVREATFEEYKCSAIDWYTSPMLTEAFVQQVMVTELWIDEAFYRNYLRNYVERSNKTIADYTEKDKMFSEIGKLIDLDVPLKVITAM